MAYGYEKSSKMQDKILDRMDNYRTTDAPRHELPKQSWTPDRWAHRLQAKVEAPKPLDLGGFAKDFNKK